MGPLRNTIQSMYNHTKAVYDKIDEMGGELPANKNLKNLAAAILSIPTGPTLERLKRALDAGNAEEKYPIGTEIEDTYAGHSNPLIVAQYLNNTNNSNYGNAEGAILLRKYVEPVSQKFVDSGTVQYSVSAAKAFLDSTYLENCSEELKAVISGLKVSYWSDGVLTTTGKWFLMARDELLSSAASSAQNPGWMYWIKKAGTSELANADSEARIMRDSNGTAYAIWTRDRSATNANNEVTVTTAGGISSLAATNTSAILPACFIAKSTSPAPAIPNTLDELKQALNEGKDIEIGTEIEDTWDGESNPLIVGTNTTINGAKAVGLLRKYAIKGVTFNTSNNISYINSNIHKYLQGDYLENCSDELKAIISEASVPYYNGSSNVGVQGKWFLFSEAEVLANLAKITEGSAWDYWKEKTGLSSPNSNSNAGRVVTNNSGAAQRYWLRTRYVASAGGATGVCMIDPDGSEKYVDPTYSNNYILPFCYVTAD